MWLAAFVLGEAKVDCFKSQIEENDLWAGKCKWYVPHRSVDENNGLKGYLVRKVWREGHAWMDVE